MKKQFKKYLDLIVDYGIKRVGVTPHRVNRALDYINGDYYFRKSIDRFGAIDKMQQLQLMMLYQYRVEKSITLPSFRDAEFRCYSQNGEDGIILLILSVIGMQTRKSVEMCAGDGITCNTANLIINHGYDSLLLDGVSANTKRGQKYYESLLDTRLWPPKLVNAWIDRTNVNSLCKDNGFDGEIDFFSLDMDGVDYWIWKELTTINPRLVVVEYNNLWPANKAVTVPYHKDFQTEYNKFGADYAGASLAAFVKLGHEKGYRLIGCQQYCFNAFFLRNDLGQDQFPEVSIESCLTHPFAKFAMLERSLNIKDKEWEEV